jgi:cytoplasmic iron level regulating protein YaaA (DUF328/UPF0246 family)
MLMLLAPSKTQDSNVANWKNETFPALLSDSKQLIARLREFSVDELGVLMKMSAQLAVQTHKRINDFQTPFTASNAKPALAVFQGDVYSRIATSGYSLKEKEYLQQHLRILSGLYGVLRPMDLMQSYRLEMGCKLSNSRGKNLYEFWGEKVTDELNRALSTHEEAFLVNLASVEYLRVIKKKKLKGKILQIDFKERKGDSYKTVAIYAKRARGMMVDFAVKNKLQSVTELQGFERENYCFQTALSTEERYVFTREQ